MLKPGWGFSYVNLKSISEVNKLHFYHISSCFIIFWHFVVFVWPYLVHFDITNHATVFSLGWTLPSIPRPAEPTKQEKNTKVLDPFVTKWHQVGVHGLEFGRIGIILQCASSCRTNQSTSTETDSKYIQKCTHLIKQCI